MKKNIGVFLLVTPLLMGVSACNKSGTPSSEIINDNKVVRLEVESAKKEYDLREVFEPSADMKVTLLGTAKTLPWHYEEGRLVIETGSLRYGDLRSTAAWVFKLSQSGL